MNIGILIPGFGANEDDWALPVYQNLVRELAKSHHVRVIALRYPHTQQPYTYHGAEVYPLGYGAWTKGIRRFKLWWDTFRLVRKLHKQQPFDVLHGIWADETGLLSGWLGKYFEIPSIVTVAGGELVRFPDIDYGLQQGVYGQWVVSATLKDNSAIVVLSKVWVIIKFGCWNKEFTHIPLGIDPTVFYPSDIERKPNHLIHVGSLIPVKNQKMLLDTMALLEDDVTLDIIGKGLLEAELKDYAKKLGINHRIKFLGNISHTQLREHYSQAQLHILTSYHEAFGMVTLEATACGTPAVGTHVGLITDAINFAYSADYPDELAEIIQWLLDSPSELENLRQKCLQVVQDKYTTKHIANQHIELYQSLIKP